MNVYCNFPNALLLLMCLFQTTHTSFDYTAYEANDVKKAASKFNLTIGASAAGATVLAHASKAKAVQPVLYLTALTAFSNVIINQKNISASK